MFDVITQSFRISMWRWLVLWASPSHPSKLTSIPFNHGPPNCQHEIVQEETLSGNGKQKNCTHRNDQFFGLVEFSCDQMQIKLPHKTTQKKCVNFFPAMPRYYHWFSMKKTKNAGAESLAPGVVHYGGHRASLCDRLGGAKNQCFGEAREKVWVCWRWKRCNGWCRSLKMDVSENSGFSPQIIHLNRVFHYFHHPFWGTPYFLNHPNLCWCLFFIVWRCFERCFCFQSCAYYETKLNFLQWLELWNPKIYMEIMRNPPLYPWLLG